MWETYTKASNWVNRVAFKLLKTVIYHQLIPVESVESNWTVALEIALRLIERQSDLITARLTRAKSSLSYPIRTILLALQALQELHHTADKEYKRRLEDAQSVSKNSSAKTSPVRVIIKTSQQREAKLVEELLQTTRYQLVSSRTTRWFSQERDTPQEITVGVSHRKFHSVATLNKQRVQTLRPHKIDRLSIRVSL